MITTIIIAMVVATTIAFFYKRSKRLMPHIPQPERCRANHIDGCNWQPDEKCDNGLCIAHCVCWCKGKHQ